MTQRPGRLQGIVEVDLPRQSEMAVMREPRYAELVFEIPPNARRRPLPVWRAT